MSAPAFIRMPSREASTAAASAAPARGLFRGRVAPGQLPSEALIRGFAEKVLAELDAMGGGRGGDGDAPVPTDIALQYIAALFMEGDEDPFEARFHYRDPLARELHALRQARVRLETFGRLFGRLWSDAQPVRILGHPAMAVGVEFLEERGSLRILVAAGEEEGGEVLPFAPDTLVADPRSWLAQLIAAWADWLGYARTGFEPPSAIFTRGDLVYWEQAIQLARPRRSGAEEDAESEAGEVLQRWHGVLCAVVADPLPAGMPLVVPEFFADLLDEAADDVCDRARALVEARRPHLIPGVVESARVGELQALSYEELHVLTAALGAMEEEGVLFRMLRSLLTPDQDGHALADLVVRQVRRIPGERWPAGEREALLERLEEIGRFDCADLLS